MRQQRMKLTADIERREQQIRQIRRELETATASSENGQKAGAPADGGNDQPAGDAGAPNDAKNGQKQ